jgi:two-component system OmpR family response regulator
MILLSQSGASRQRILVVDDEPDIVEYLCTALEDNGYETMGVIEADKALAAAKSFGPSAILLDVLMPGHSGLALYRDMRLDAALANVPVIFLSGYPATKQDGSRTPRWEEWKVPPPEGFLDKPVSISTLLATIKKILYREGRGGANG